MEPIIPYAEHLNHLPVDLRAEVVLAELLEEGVSPDQLIVNPVGAFKRPFGRDIDQATWRESTHTAKRWLQLDLNRTGLYDLLPEGVFHQPTSGEVTRSKETLLLEMKVQREREQAARRFFLPIEQEFFRQRVRIEQEQRAFGSDAETAPDDRLGRFWNLPDFLTPAQTSHLLYLLPVMHRIAGDFRAMADCFARVVEESVSLQRVSPGHTRVEAPTPPLGEWQLGATSVLDGWLPDEEPQVLLTVHLTRRERLAEYLPGQTGRKLIEWLAGYLVPLDLTVRIELDTATLEEPFRFSGDEYAARLDFTTRL
ncbi:type VI secretion system baseplate subunit TssG [Larkinella ripae]